ncbi:MAG: iron-containing alcohol dehydrogenase [Dysosmobacter sp.]
MPDGGRGFPAGPGRRLRHRPPPRPSAWAWAMTGTSPGLLHRQGPHSRLRSPVGTVLTISAAGSEGCDSCVITQEAGNLKWGCPKSGRHPAQILRAGPHATPAPCRPTRLACGAVDMLAHLCERYFTNTAGRGPDGPAKCEAVMRTVVDAAPKGAWRTTSDYAARADLMWAGMLAQQQLLRRRPGSGDWASHQMEHELSAFYVLRPRRGACGGDARVDGVRAAAMTPCALPGSPSVRASAAVRWTVRPSGAHGAGGRLPAAGRSSALWACPPRCAESRRLGGRTFLAMVAHRARKSRTASFGGFVKIQEADMEAILRRCAS